MLMCAATVVIFTGLLAVAIMSSKLTVYKVEFVDGMECDKWSKVNKLLCFGGTVNFQKPPQNIGKAVYINITLAGSNRSTQLSIIDFDECGNLSFMLEHKNKKICACTGSLNDMFNYTCAKRVNTSDSGSIIRVFLENLNGQSVIDVSLRFPLVSKEESSSIPESETTKAKQFESVSSSIPESETTKAKQFESVYTWLMVSIAAVVILFIVSVFLVICCFYIWRANKKKAQVIQDKDKEIKRYIEENDFWKVKVSNSEDELTIVKKELQCFKDRAALEPHNKSTEVLPIIPVSQSKYLKPRLTHSAFVQEPSNVKDDCPEHESTPLLKVRSNEAICPAKQDKCIIDLKLPLSDCPEHESTPLLKRRVLKMLLFIFITNVLLYIGIIAFPNKSLTIYKLDSVEGIDCQPWSLNVRENKHLCWGGNVSFQKYSKDIGRALHMKIILADSNKTQLLSLIAFEECRKQLGKTLVCAYMCSNTGYKSFNYNCAKAFNSSDNESIISVQIHDMDGGIVEEALLELPLFSKKETSSKPASDLSSGTPGKTEPATSTPDPRRTSEQTICLPGFVNGFLIGVLACVLIAALAFSIWLNWKQSKTIKKLKEQSQSVRETKDVKPEDGKKELEEQLGAIQVSQERKLNKLSRDLEAVQKLTQARDNDTKSDGICSPLLTLRGTQLSPDQHSNKK
ncbi:hypothetical protein Bpfe_003676 [Biomphalaria pfeifferi]|uniref:Uncharacterized protein n=1 Tax=Biomphalaria pfeifferi TaxID=112525 RepID=A0AAD8C5N9_BIOPF|nr:hypothetical protein Bpfe_003676 [Biomphalaria pfeifferi]